MTIAAEERCGVERLYPGETIGALYPGEKAEPIAAFYDDKQDRVVFLGWKVTRAPGLRSLARRTAYRLARWLDERIAA